MTITLDDPHEHVDGSASSPSGTTGVAESVSPGALSISRLARWLFVMFVGIFTVRTTIDPDLFWHLRTGEYILDNGIPRSDVFSFTVPDRPWVTHEWLTQVLAWLTYTVGGLPGVSLLFALVGAAAVTFTYKTVTGGPLQKVALTSATMFVSTVAYGARIQLVTLAFATGFVWLIEKVRSGEFAPTKLWWLVPVTVLWANLHSGFLLGVVLLAVYAVGDALHRRFLGDDPTILSFGAATQLGKVAGLSFLAAVANPSGPKLWLYPFETLRSEQMRELIAEWQSPDFHMSVFRPFLLLIVGAFAVFAASKRRPTVTELLLVGGTIAAGLTSLRHVALAAVVCMPVLARHLTSALGSTRLAGWSTGERDRRLGVGPVFTVAVAAVLASVVGVRAVATLAVNDEVIEKRFPVAAVDFLEDTDLAAEHGYNSYGWGGYLIWRGVEVFSDGRADVYGEEFLATVGALDRVESDWEDRLDHYDVEWALVPVDEPMVTLMTADPDWVLAYEDELAAVMVRRQ